MITVKELVRLAESASAMYSSRRFVVVPIPREPSLLAITDPPAKLTETEIVQLVRLLVRDADGCQSYHWVYSGEIDLGPAPGLGGEA